MATRDAFPAHVLYETFPATTNRNEETQKNFKKETWLSGPQPLHSDGMFFLRWQHR